MNVERLKNVVEIIMNGEILNRTSLINKLTASEQRLKSLESYSQQDPHTAMKAATKFKKRHKPEWNKKRGPCFNCQKMGHFQKDCRKPIKLKEAMGAQTHVKNFLFSAQVEEHRSDENIWLLDSGASAHMVTSLHQLTNARPTIRPTAIVLGDGREIAATHVGDAKVSDEVTLTNVLYVPGLRENLFSLSVAASTHDTEVIIKDEICKILQGGKEAIRAKKQHGVFRIQASAAQVQSPPEQNRKLNLMDLHRKCGHTNFATIGLMIKQGILPKVTSKDDGLRKSGDSCSVCLKGKMTRTIIPKKAQKRQTSPGELIHSDLCGPMRTQSIQGSLYMVSYIDDATGWIHLAFLKHKSEQLKEFKSFESYVQRQFGVKIRRLRSDNGGEYSSMESQDFMKEKGIIWERSAPRTPQQNGRAERANRTIIEMARCLLLDADLPHKYWQYAATMAAYIRNRTPTTTNLNQKSPFWAMHGVTPDLTKLPIFGCKTLVHVPDEHRGKLDAKAQECIFLGYASGSKAAVYENQISKKRFVSRDATILGRRVQHAYEIRNEKLLDEEIGSRTRDVNEMKVPPQGQPSSQPQVDQDENQKDETPTLSKRAINPPIRYMHEYAYTASASNEEPSSVQEALRSHEWKQAMQEEYDALVKSNTWKLHPRPVGRNVVSGKWCFRAKKNSEGNITRYKARYVARGFSQKYGVDYDETSSPVVSLTSLRAVLAIAAKLSMKIKQLDVNSAFLYGNLQEEIYLEQPEGFEIEGKDQVCRLKKAIYGLKQAGRVWWKLIDEHLKSSGFKSTLEDPCVYQRKTNEDSIIIAIYVDDLIIASNEMKSITDLETNLRTQYDMKPMGDAEFILGIRIDRDHSTKTLTLSQSAYAKAILERFDMMNSRSVSAPASSGSKLESHEGEGADYPYQSAIGSLMYLAIATRPDLAQAVSNVSRFAANPSQNHVKAVKTIFRYLRGTIDMGVKFGGSTTEGLVAYTDADFGGCSTTRRSTTGFIIMLNGGPVSWASRRQGCVSLSTTEAEYIALCAATQEVVWLRGLLSSLGQPQHRPTTIFEDNQSTIALAEFGRTSRRSKHIEVKYHYTRSKIEDGSIALQYCATATMIADALTKALPAVTFLRHREKFLNSVRPAVGLGGSVENYNPTGDDSRTCEKSAMVIDNVRAASPSEVSN